MGWRASVRSIASPSISMEPLVLGRRPARTSTSSRWPLPATPAMPRISPAFTCSETSVSAGRPRSPSADRLSTDRTVAAPGSAPPPWRITDVTSLPTMSSARLSREEPAASTVATDFPSRSTVIRSAIEATSPSLWEMKITLLPCRAIERNVVTSDSASGGVRTAVGSSMMSTCASRYSTFKISTRCCSPTESCQILARGSTGIANCSASSTIRSSADFVSSRKRREGGCVPRMMFSVTVNVGINRKCWCTIPIPASIAAFGESKMV